MNADDILRGLRYTQKKYENKGIMTGETDVPAMCRDTADLIESLQAQLSDARNELCQKCGKYHEAHKGACDGCRWKENLNA